MRDSPVWIRGQIILDELIRLLENLTLDMFDIVIGNYANWP